MQILKTKFLILFIITIISIPFLPNSFSHGLGYELLPPIQVGDKALALEVASTPLDEESKARQISFRLLDLKTNEQQTNLIYFIKGYKANQLLFDESFEIKEGDITLDLIPTDSESILVKNDQGGLFGSLFGPSAIELQGSVFNYGGLYTFDVQIQTIDDYQKNNDNTLQYDVGISFPDLVWYDVHDPNFGEQQLGVVTYYEVIEDFAYDPNTRSITFRMPFDWSSTNIEQTSVVHEEILIPKAFGDLLVSSYSFYVNDNELPQDVITIDGFSNLRRIVHLVMNENHLSELLGKLDGQNEMRFLLKPSAENIPLSSVTGNGQFRIMLSWEPQNLVSNSNVKFFFKTLDVFLQNRPIATDYDVNVMFGEEELYTQTGTSNELKDVNDSLEFFIPEHVSGIITVNFVFDDNSFAKTTFPVIVNRITETKKDVISIPNWVKNNAKWWAEGKLPDKDFASGIEYMIKNNIIKVPITSGGEASDDISIPNWVKNNAKWWAEGKLPDKDFANGIQYLVTNGIISV